MGRITLSKPLAGQTDTMTLRQGVVYVIAFDINDAVWDMDGGNAVVRFDDGAVLLLRDFVGAAQGESFMLELPGGELIAGSELAWSLDTFQTDTGAVADAPSEEIGVQAAEYADAAVAQAAAAKAGLAEHEEGGNTAPAFQTIPEGGAPGNDAADLIHPSTESVIGHTGGESFFSNSGLPAGWTPSLVFSMPAYQPYHTYPGQEAQDGEAVFSALPADYSVLDAIRAFAEGAAFQMPLYAATYGPQLVDVSFCFPAKELSCLSLQDVVSAAPPELMGCTPSFESLSAANLTSEHVSFIFQADGLGVDAYISLVSNTAEHTESGTEQQLMLAFLNMSWG